jgi:methyl-accepting chemotaxis protein
MGRMIKKWFSKLGQAKVVDLDNDGKIESLADEVQGLTFRFKTMVEQIQTVNDKLLNIADEEKIKAEEARKRIEEVNKQLEQNVKLQEKLSDFIV